jgi:hypothetical protein
MFRFVARKISLAPFRNDLGPGEFLAQILDGFDSILAWHEKIADHEIRGLGTISLDCMLAVRGTPYPASPQIIGGFCRP